MAPVQNSPWNWMEWAHVSMWFLAQAGRACFTINFLKAGANGFIEKPFVGLSGFQLKMLRKLPESHFFPVFVSDTHEIVEPKPAIYAEDLRKAHDPFTEYARYLTKKYLSQFLKSVCAIADNQEMLTALERD